MHSSFVVLSSTFAFALGCATSGIRETTATTGTVATPADSQAHHSRGLCTPAMTSTAPASGWVAQFSTANRKEEEEVPGRLVTYAIPTLASSAAFSSSASDGSLTIKINATATSRPQLLGTMIEFDRCIDASAFTGVQFTIKGSFSGCALTYGTGDVGHEDATTSETFASGAAGAYVPQYRIEAADLISTPKTLQLPFARATIQGNPAVPIDPSKLIFALWQFVVPVAADDGSATPACTANVAIGDLRFYR